MLFYYFSWNSSLSNCSALYDPKIRILNTSEYCFYELFYMEEDIVFKSYYFLRSFIVLDTYPLETNCYDPFMNVNKFFMNRFLS